MEGIAKVQKGSAASINLVMKDQSKSVKLSFGSRDDMLNAALSITAFVESHNDDGSETFEDVTPTASATKVNALAVVPASRSASANQQSMAVSNATPVMSVTTPPPPPQPAFHGVFTRRSETITCPHCSQTTSTRVRTEPTGVTWAWALCLCCFTGFCCFIPFLCKSCQETQHSCQRCNRIVGSVGPN